MIPDENVNVHREAKNIGNSDIVDVYFLLV